jgi:hypothetical protein
MERKIFKLIFLLFCLLMSTTLEAQETLSSSIANVEAPTNSKTVNQKNFLLKRLMRSGVGYLQIVEDDVVFLQIVEDDVVFLKRIRDEGVKIRRFTQNNQKTVQFLKDTTVLKSIVEDDVVFLKSIVEDDVVFLESFVDGDVVFLKSKDNTNLLKPNNSKQIKSDTLKKVLTNSLKQSIHDSLRQIRRDSLKRMNAIKHLSVGLIAGVTNVPGVDLAYKFRPHWTVRLGFGYLDYAKNNFRTDITTKDATGTDVTKSFSASVAAHFSNVSGLLEYGVGYKGRFRLIAGAAVFPDKKLTASGELLSNVQLNAVSLVPSDLGSGGVEVGFVQKVSPYIGFGIGRATPRRRLNLSLDFGAYYMGDYQVKININQGVILKENETNGPIIERNLNARMRNKILPSGNLRISYRLY